MGLRIDKYSKKINGSIIGKRYDDTKKIAVDLQTKYFAKAAELEVKVKSIVSNQPVILHHFYIAYAEEIVKKTQDNERTIVYNKWLARGLSGAMMEEIGLALIGWDSPFTPPSLKRYEYYIINDTENRPAGGVNWIYQRFTVGNVGINENHNITSVKLKIYRLGNPGTMIVGIREVDGVGKPTGGDLSNGSINANLLGIGPGVFVEISMSSYTLQASKEYAIVIRCPDGNIITDCVNARTDGSWPYPYGEYHGWSNNSGGTWTAGGTKTILFEEWGMGPQP